MKRSTLKGLFSYLAISLVGLLILFPMQKSSLEANFAEIEAILSQLNIEQVPSIDLIALLTLVQTFILLLPAMLIGYFLAHRLNLSSLIMQSQPFWSGLKKVLPVGIISGLLVGVFIRGTDLLMHPFLPEAIKAPIETPSVEMLIGGVIYGGIFEELMMRWGIMTLFVFIFWKVFQRRSSQPSPSIYWSVIIISAILFGLGHLPATANVTDITPLLVARATLLNGLGGVVYGWLYWKHNLEAAIISHMFTHIGMNATMLIMSLFV